MTPLDFLYIGGVVVAAFLMFVVDTLKQERREREHWYRHD